MRLHRTTLLLAALALCTAGFQCTPKGDRHLGGSTWTYHFRHSVYVGDPPDGEYQELIYDFDGRFTIPEEPNDRDRRVDRFEVGDHETELRVRFTQVPDASCEGVSGEVDLTGSQLANVLYTRHYDATPNLLPPEPLFGWGHNATADDAYLPRHLALLTWGVNDVWFDEVIAAGSMPPGSTYTYGCATEYDSWTVESTTPGLLPFYQYIGPIHDGSSEHWGVEGPGGFSVSTIRFDCVSGCEGRTRLEDKLKEEEDDPCDEDAVQQECDDFKANALEYCQNLEDWMVVEDGLGGTEVTCGDPDCSGAIERNAQRGEDPWSSFTLQLDLACPDSDFACSVECYGWVPLVE